MTRSTFAPALAAAPNFVGRMARHWQSALLGIFLLLEASAQAGPPISFQPPRRWRIVPIGDSITQGNTGHWTYRYPLWKMLIDAGVDFDLVGSLNYFDNINPAIPPYRGVPFDFDHEGHVFFQSGEIAGPLPGWMSGSLGSSGGYTPDIALVHVGTNDALLAIAVPTTVTNLTSIITSLRARNPRVQVLLAKIISTYSFLDPAGAVNARMTAINDQIDGIAAATDRPDSRVIVVDQNTGFLPNHTVAAPTGGDTYDGVHPSPAGEEKMARRWLEALQLLLMSPSVTRDAEGRMTVDFLRVKNSPRLTYRVGVSSDLDLWDWAPAATESVSTTSTGDWSEWVRIRDLTSVGPRFLQLVVDYAQ